MSATMPVSNSASFERTHKSILIMSGSRGGFINLFVLVLLSIMLSSLFTLQFKSIQSQYTLYLWHKSKLAPLHPPSDKKSFFANKQKKSMTFSRKKYGFCKSPMD